MVGYLKLKALEETRDFYNVELVKELTEKEKNGYLKALKLIEGFIEKKKKLGGDENKNPFLKPEGGIDLIDEFVGIDYMPYESKKKRKNKR